MSETDTTPAVLAHFLNTRPKASKKTLCAVNHLIPFSCLGVEAREGAVGFVPVFVNRPAADRYRATLENPEKYGITPFRRLKA